MKEPTKSDLYLEATKKARQVFYAETLAAQQKHDAAVVEAYKEYVGQPKARVSLYESAYEYNDDKLGDEE